LQCLYRTYEDGQASISILYARMRISAARVQKIPRGQREHSHPPQKERFGASMNVVGRIGYLLALLVAYTFGQMRTIRLVIEPQEGGYGLVTSPEFPGYSFLLKPGEGRDFLTMGHAMGDKLERYIELEESKQAERKAIRHHSNAVRFMGISTDDAGTLIAKICIT